MAVVGRGVGHKASGVDGRGGGGWAVWMGDGRVVADGFGVHVGSDGWEVGLRGDTWVMFCLGSDWCIGAGEIVFS